MKQLYHSYDEAVALFKELESRRPDLFRTEVIGQTWEKREIIAVTITQNIEIADTKPALFFTGTIHAREWIGLELAIGFAQYVDRNIAYDHIVQEALENSTIYMVPCANPDGFEYSRNHFSFWRKNRRQNADGSYGVDLNRNFPVGFVKSNNPSSNVYGGPAPFSEPETRAIRDFVESHKNIAIALDYHSQGNVFFPAHDFRHEDTIDTTDMNVLCANMAEEIRKISDREYGIHQGKPPTKLISGSGREFYYSKGIIASVVEVGTRNISDYLDDMIEHIREHIPALLTCLKEVPNYAIKTVMPRPENFRATYVGIDNVTLEWEPYSCCKDSDEIYFEIYRSRREKSYCRPFNLIGLTQANRFSDSNLQSDSPYFYHIRAVNKKSGQKSPFAPVLAIRTHVDDDEFHRTYFPIPDKTGYVAQKSKDNASHFGVNSLFVGVNETKGISYSVITIPLKTIPKNAVIKRARLRLYPMNRVGVTVEKFGEWDVGIVDPNSIGDLTSFKDVEAMKIRSYVGRPTLSNHLTQGIWRSWEFSEVECKALQEQITNEQVVFRIEGPKTLSIGRTSQMMQWDIGYGKFGGGLAFRPHLEITYTLEPNRMELFPKQSFTVCADGIEDGKILSGFDSDGKKIYATFDFELGSLPDWEFMQITRAYVVLNPIKVYAKDNIRFHLEMIDADAERDYEAIKARRIIENIGYDVSVSELKNQEQVFVFDTYAIQEFGNRLRDKKSIAFLLRPSSAQKLTRNSVIEWHSSHPEFTPKLVIEYLHKRRRPVSPVTNLSFKIENGKVRLSWKNPKDKDFKGVFVIKNRFRKPISPYDGDKLYGGPDDWTNDDFGALDVKKYYAVFTYDDVPNFSEPVILEYQPKNSG
ncbi:M14 family zinc carboxypeptidase [Hydrogenimonas thermophila]|uniref:M14 family zinc carboxypeptidase n=1 Tax=Hydrogenimonas thermophila TaxID=223786 RepID=UPI00293710AC|nr:M14 family zinc carboxypeptidase [Hydrogenimonas thermophila]WOE69968.1 M14 family zinc carboxypeptidase [Hydrogenimonas thermophila]WOE72485.1 M14 family zinc carboxypeptidase [Hydrogenimonas thermophila]